MSRNSLVHPRNPNWRLRLHPTSRIFRHQCFAHGLSCPHPLSLRLHHVLGSWTSDERDAHPVWAHDLVDVCASEFHQCDELCGYFEVLPLQGTPAILINNTAKTPRKTPDWPTLLGRPTVHDEIAYFHGSKHWDAHWESPPDFSLHSALAHMLNPTQTALVGKHLHQMREYYIAMDAAGFFAKTAGFMTAMFRSAHPERPAYPTSAFGAGFSGFDRLDERGWDRAGYQATKGHSPDEWELRSRYQIVYFIALGRSFQIPAGQLVAYDPCYSLVDLVLLATLGIRAFRKGDPGLKHLRKFTNPTLFYAPGAEQDVFTDAITRADPIVNLIILGGDAAWCEERTTDFTAHYACILAPAYVTASNGESPCGEENCLQWIPRSRVDAFNLVRGPATEPTVRQMVMPDGSLEPDN